MKANLSKASKEQAIEIIKYLSDKFSLNSLDYIDKEENFPSTYSKDIKGLIQYTEDFYPEYNRMREFLNTLDPDHYHLGFLICKDNLKKQLTLMIWREVLEEFYKEYC